MAKKQRAKRERSRRRLRFDGKRFARVVFSTLGLASVFTTSVVVGVVLHVNVPAMRRVTARELARALSGTFYGSIDVGNIEHLGLDGTTVSELRVSDVQGNQVLSLTDVRIRTGVLTLLHDVLFAEEKITVIVRQIRAEQADVLIVPDENGVPTIGRALTPVPSKPTTPSAPSAPKKPVRVWLPAIDIARIYARGTVGGLPTLEVNLGNVKGSVLATQKGVAVDVHRYGMTVRGLGGTDATGTGELHVRAPGAIWGSYDGFFGNLPLSTSVQVKGDHVTATVDVPKGMPEDVRLLLPDWPLQKAVSAHVEASGEVPELLANARFEVEGAKLTAAGPIRFGKDFGIKLDVQGRKLDLRAIWPEAPETRVDVDTAVSLFDKKGQVVVDVNGTTAATTLLGQPVPPMDVSGTYNEKGFEGKATLHEDGMPVKVGFTVHPKGAVDIDARAPSFQIEKAPRVAKLTSARGRAEVEVKARIEDNQLSGTMVGDVSRFELGDMKLAHARVSGRAKGALNALDKLDIDAKLQGRELAARGVSYQGVTATARGAVTRPVLTAKLTDEENPDVDAKATLEMGTNPGVRNVSVALKRDGVSLGGEVSRFDFDASEVKLDTLALEGAGGALTGAARIGPGRVEVHAKGTSLDLDRVARALRLPRGMIGGKLNVDADVVASKNESHGHVRIGLGQGSINNFSGIALSVDAKLDGEAIEGKAHALMEGVGGLGARFSGKLDGNAALAKSWAGIVGESEIQLSDLDLSLLRHVLPASARIEKVEGTAFARVRVNRAKPEELPNIRVEVAGTRGLEVVRSGEKPSDEPQVFKGIEVLTVNTGISGQKGDASGTIQLVDRTGALLTTTGSVRMDWRKLLATPTDWLTLVSDAPVLVVLAMDDRRLAELPEPIRPTSVVGSAHGRVMLSGSLAKLHVSANVGATGLQPVGNPRALPVDLVALGEYDLDTGRYGADVQLKAAQHRVARLGAQGTFNIYDGSWTTGAQLALEGVPLGILPGFAESYVEGRLDGTVALQRPKSDEPPRLSATIALNQASIDRTALGKGSLSARTDGEQLRADLELDDSSGTVKANVRAGIDWSGGLPNVDRARPVRIEAEAEGYDAAVLSPFLRDLFSRLTGKVDGQVSITLETPKGSKGQPVGDWEARVSGQASVRQGVLQIAELGLELSDVSFNARASESGRLSIISINDVSGKARSETPNVNGQATLVLDGVRVVRGTGSIQITKDMPLLFQGVSQATATGNAQLKLEREPDSMRVEVDVSSLVAKLPESSGRSVVELGDNPAIVVAQPLREPRPKRTGEILPWKFVINLGRGVKLRRSDLEIPLVGQPIVKLGQKTDVTGYVELEPGGRFQAWGKTFVIDTGRVIFDTPDPADPHITASANWRGPDGTIVYADVRGTLKEAKIAVSSDPPRSEPEIMAILFGGSSAGSGAEDTGSSRSREGSAAAGGVLATAFNSLFAESLSRGPVQVELRTSTNEDKASYTAAVRLAENIWFEGTYRNRLEAQQDATSAEPVDVSGTIDYRFRRNWSLRTEVGTLGAGLDLLFQYRY